jgi:hypothetical protein
LWPPGDAHVEQRSALARDDVNHTSADGRAHSDVAVKGQPQRLNCKEQRFFMMPDARNRHRFPLAKMRVLAVN